MVSIVIHTVLDFEINWWLLKKPFLCDGLLMKNLCFLGLRFPWQKNSLDVGEDSTLCDGDS